MKQLQLTVDQDSQLLNDLVSTGRLPHPFPFGQARRDRPHPGALRSAYRSARVTGQLWSATELGKELGSVPRP